MNTILAICFIGIQFVFFFPLRDVFRQVGVAGRDLWQSTVPVFILCLAILLITDTTIFLLLQELSSILSQGGN